MKIQSIKLPKSWEIFWIFIILSIGFFAFSFSENKEIPKPKIVITPTITIAPKQESIQPTKTITLPKSQGTIVITTPIPTQANSTNINQNTNSNTQSNTLNVTLAINGGPGFTVTVPPGANQCDVLSEAQRIGKINSLNMRYNSDLETNAVYQINDMGKENQVWWGYKVNGKSPSFGCSQVKVNNNDSINWTYVGN